VNQVIGARFVGHPGGEHQFQASDVLVLDRSHPATRRLPAKWRWTEEYYSFAAPPPADAHVLARLDERGMTLEPKLKMGNAHALIWWRCKGRARVFFSALGHQPQAWSDPQHLKLLDGALGWAARREGKGCD
jgi:type 1 glutamine amidotransferase